MVAETQHREVRSARTTRVLDAASPRLARRLVPHAEQVAAGLDEEAVQAIFAQHVRGAVDDVALADASEPDAHASRNAYGAVHVIGFDALVVDEPPLLRHFIVRRYPRVLLGRVAEAPQIGHRLKGHIERTVGDATGPKRSLQDLQGFRLHAHGAPLRQVDPSDVARRLPDAEQGFESVYLVERRRDSVFDLLLSVSFVRVGHHLDHGAHRRMLSADRRHGRL